jgi:hypothetical protein
MTTTARKTKRTPSPEPIKGVVFVRSGKWWAAELPSFPGAYGQGKTQLEAYSSLMSAISEQSAIYARESARQARA